MLPSLLRGCAQRFLVAAIYVVSGKRKRKCVGEENVMLKRGGDRLCLQLQCRLVRALRMGKSPLCTL